MTGYYYFLHIVDQSVYVGDVIEVFAEEEESLEINLKIFCNKSGRRWRYF